jgi:hypothetical protein
MSGTENNHRPCTGPSIFNAVLDKLGILASGLCMIHCLVVPLLLLLLPSLLSGVEDSTHKILLWVVTPLALMALVQGYLRHRCLSPLIVGFIGLLLMGLSLILDTHVQGLTLHSLLMLGAGGCLLVAHTRNLKRCTHSNK